jgi:hypothetical protein
MNNPHEKLITALLLGTKNARSTADELKKWNLPIPDNLEQRLKDLLREGPFSIKFLQNYDIEPLYGYCFNHQVTVDIEGVKEAFDLLGNDQTRRLMFSMCLSQMTAEEIELLINEKYDTTYPSKAFDYFLAYFFDVSSLSYTERRDLFRSFSPDSETSKMFKLAVSGDRPYLLWKLGLAPDIRMDTMLKSMAIDSYYIFKEKSKSDPEMATKFGTLALRLADKLEKVAETEEEAENLFNKFIFEVDHDENIKRQPTHEEIGAEISTNTPEPSIEMSDKTPEELNLKVEKPINSEDLE